MGPLISLLLVAALITSQADAATWTLCKYSHGEENIPRGAANDYVDFLHLDRCGINNLTEEDFNVLPNLNMIRISYNDIPYLDPAVFRGIIRVKTLHLEGNNLQTMPVFGAQSVLPNLTSLHVTGNEITKLDDPRTFSSTKLLEVLIINDNKIEFIHPDMFSGLTKLKYLYLNRNKLTYVDDKVFALSSLNSLTAISIRDNLLESVAPGAFRNTRLQELYLQGNRLTHLSEDFFATDGAQLTWFCYHKNPWRCAFLDKIVARRKEVDLKCVYFGREPVCSP
ncbi:leucine-rich repeat-containing protein 15-like [Cydia pomonella]|uniref:leucine-rich repeat-containing protein 15-like n=1 Tax=Cydia pomonella TaxID=82600 RepID=UPI002ADD7721|nr:leucine-rich repeat-containing protein 15-like [Cydia pomonella]